ncbi:phosphoglycerate mutase-like protein [Karstenula rhodostoma CBS 690.94]|uniref:Phosphoglycerate mutase-like protein n=1 Tax=Karstenula rhodostoma CBS 690.94 TaxID=1392251 RepID=A0A9P4UDA5_9PLEO|nr:phosphoglycerate mutase-like protein [Karstenula rhodostoma CBS 690.94]
MLLPSLALLVAARAVQGQSSGTETNHGTVAFIRTGERTPWVRSGTEALSALGAQQMLELGDNFRGRYIDQETGATRLGVYPIEGMAPHRLNPDQLFIQTLDRPYLVAAAQSFMQGLYPQYSLSETKNGLYPDAVWILANRSAVDYPLDGYQYANVMTVGANDPGSIYLDGHDQCPRAWLESANYEITDEFLSTQAAESAFYQSLSPSWFKRDLSDSMLDYRNAYAIYDSLSYHYTHDINTLKDLSNGDNTGVFEKVRYLANQDAWYRYGNVSSDTDSTNANRAIAGKTLAGLITKRFERIINNEGNTTNGMSQPLNLLFGEYDAMLSLLSVLEADYYQSGSIREEIPEFASALIFDLFTRGNDTADVDNLRVRFSFHNGTQGYQDSAPQSYSIFRNGPDKAVITWREFSAGMSRVAIRQSRDWCARCSSQSVFCPTLDDTTTSFTAAEHPHAKISPVVAGVIGAIVTLAVAALLFGAAMLLGGIRLHRVERRRQSSSLGGFKGSAKLASDPDLGLANKGVAPASNDPFADPNPDPDLGSGATRRVVHERVGSWELRAKEGRASGGESPRSSFEAIEAAMGRPVRAVQPLERI